MEEDFEITIASLPDYEELVAEIHIQGKFIGLLSQEAYPKTILELQLFGPVRIDLELFERAVARAKQRLWELRKEG